MAGATPMTLDERLEAITMNLELASHEIQELRKLVQVDAENIRALARIAEIHEKRLSAIEEN
jgi:hypothetical protein